MAQIAQDGEWISTATSGAVFRYSREVWRCAAVIRSSRLHTCHQHTNNGASHPLFLVRSSAPNTVSSSVVSSPGAALDPTSSPYYV